MKVRKTCGPPKPKLGRKGIVVRGAWKAVEVDPGLFSEQGFEGLVCFEELTDYSLVKPEKAATEKTAGRKTPKRKASEAADELPTEKKKKRRKKSEDSSGEQSQSSTPEEDGASVTQSPSTTTTTTKKKEKKKKKNKKQKKIKASPAEVPSGPVCGKKKSRNWSSGVLLQPQAEQEDVDMSAWKDLFVPAPVLRALAAQGFTAPTAIQALTLPPAIRDRLDLLAAAETGSGKTLCFGIPMIHCILERREAQERASELAEAGGEKVKSERPLLGLVLTPTRELAVQIKHHIDAAAQYTGITSAIVVGGMAAQKQQRILNRRPEIVIATPGRLWELIKEKHAHLQDLRQLRCLVIDEADRMVERGHFAELENLMELLNTSQFSSCRQTLVFSATLTVKHSLPQRVLQRKRRAPEPRSKLDLLMEKVGMKDKPKVVDLTRKQATVETLTETRISCTQDEKDQYLYYFLLQHPGRTMVFANSIACIKRLSALLQILDRGPLQLHANMHQKQRLKNLERFAEKESSVLLTTDVAARGLDVPDVQHVIHYQVPHTSETYVHRSGRTARATKAGLSLLLIGPDDVLNFKKICRTLEKTVELPAFPVEIMCMRAIKERVDLAHKIEKMEYFNSREKQHNSWVKQAADALELDVDDELLLGNGKSEDDDREQQKMLKALKKQLKHLISQPVFRNNVKTRYPTQMGRPPALHNASRDTALDALRHTTKQQC